MSENFVLACCCFTVSSLFLLKWHLHLCNLWNIGYVFWQINRKGFFLDIKLFMFVSIHHRPKLVVSVDKVDGETTGRLNDSSATVHGACPRAKTLFPRPHQQTKNRPADPWERNGVCLQWRKTFHRSTWTKRDLAGPVERHDSCTRSV